MKTVRWMIVFGGAWIAASPWVLGFASANLPRWSNVFVGGLVAIGALALATHKE